MHAEDEAQIQQVSKQGKEARRRRGRAPTLISRAVIGGGGLCERCICHCLPFPGWAASSSIVCCCSLYNLSRRKTRPARTLFRPSIPASWPCAHARLNQHPGVDRMGGNLPDTPHKQLEGKRRALVPTRMFETARAKSTEPTGVWVGGIVKPYSRYAVVTGIFTHFGAFEKARGVKKPPRPAFIASCSVTQSCASSVGVPLKSSGKVVAACSCLSKPGKRAWQSKMPRYMAWLREPRRLRYAICLI